MLGPDELQAKLDMEWLRRLMWTEQLEPRLLVAAQKHTADIHERSEKLREPDEWHELWIEHEEATNAYHLAQEDFWLRLGLSLGAQIQWTADNAEALEVIEPRLGNPTPLELRPEDYMTAVTAAARWVDIEHGQVPPPEWMQSAT